MSFHGTNHTHIPVGVSMFPNTEAVTYTSRSWNKRKTNGEEEEDTSTEMAPLLRAHENNQSVRCEHETNRVLKLHTTSRKVHGIASVECLREFWS